MGFQVVGVALAGILCYPQQHLQTQVTAANKNRIKGKLRSGESGFPSFQCPIKGQKKNNYEI